MRRKGTLNSTGSDSPPAPRAPASLAAGNLIWSRGWACAGLLVLAVIAAYAGARRAGFIWDDDAFLTENPLIRAADGLRRFWFTGEPVDYWPVTSTTLWFEWRLWGLNPLGYHVTNVLLHAVEVVLLWRILARLRMPGAFLAAALFAVHPVNVDSVVWITQRKNLMAMLFYLLSILFFLRAEDAQNAGEGNARPWARWYGFSLIAFTLAMLSKGSVAMLPIVLLGIVAWRRPVTRLDLVRMIPFFGVAAALVYVNFRFTVHGAAEVASTASFTERLLGAGAVVWFYLGKAYFPVHLTFIYPLWTIRAANPLCWLPLGGAAGLTVLLWLMRHRWGRGPLFAWLYFGVSLVPVMGFTDVYFMHYSLVSDHYEHLALIGAIAPVAAAFALWRASAAGLLRLAGDAAAVLTLAGLAWLTSLHCADYVDAETLWRTTIARNPACWMAYDNLANDLLQKGRSAEAEAVCRKALEMEPNQAKTRATLGIALDLEGRPEEAIKELRASMALQPGIPETYENLGKALMETGRVADAVESFQTALRLNPVGFKTLNNLGAAYAREGRLDSAIACFRRSLAIRNDFAEAHYNLGNALHGKGLDGDAEGEFRRAIAADPRYAGAYVNLGNILMRRGLLAEAIAQYRRALDIEPRFANARHNLEVALREQEWKAEHGGR